MLNQKKISWNNPEYVIVDGKKLKINTDFRVALKCQEVAEDTSINDYERALSVIYLLFGEEAFSCDENKLLEYAIKYLKCGKEDEGGAPPKERDMDMLQDYDLIVASFMSDYQIDIEEREMHWWTFEKLLNGLTDKCILNRVRDIRTMDLNEVKDPKARRNLQIMKQQYKLREKPVRITKEQQDSANKFFELTGIERR